MIRSMTGFASKITTISLGDGQKVDLSISIKSLNSRFFEATCKLPYVLNSLETVFIKLLKQQIVRGHLYLTVYLNNPQVFKGSVEPSLSTIQGYLDAIAKVKKELNISGDITMQDVLQLPQSFNIEEKGIDETFKTDLLAVTEDLIKDLLREQLQEGNTLLQDINLRISLMEKEIAAIELCSEKLMTLQKAKIQANLAEIIGNEDENSDLKRHALYAMLDKMDIHEEIVRFKSHLGNLKNLLASAETEKGKRLDFTLQELGREINTIAAKCSDATIGAHAINVKVELEKAREQTQNIV